MESTKRRLRSLLVSVLRWLVEFFLIRPEEIWPPKLVAGGNEMIDIRKQILSHFCEGDVEIRLRSNPQRVGTNPVVTLKICSRNSGGSPRPPDQLLADLARTARSDGAILTECFAELDFVAAVLPPQTDRWRFADTLMRRADQLLNLYDLQGRYYQPTPAHFS